LPHRRDVRHPGIGGPGWPGADRSAAVVPRAGPGFGDSDCGPALPVASSAPSANRPGLRRAVPGRGELAQERVGEAVAGYPDARVHGDGTVRAGDHGVEVKLGDLRQVVGEP
jgi:hypothetical protein